MKRKNWFRLDNAAKIYPSNSSNRRSSVFSVAAVLNERIDAQLLSDAVNVVLNRFPTFKVKLKRGVFWYYLEENKNPFIVREEPGYFLRFIDETLSGGYLFNVFYTEYKITLAIFHVLTDGTGALEFLKALVFEYLSLKGLPVKAEDGLKTLYSPSTSEEYSDKFLQVYGKKNRPVKVKKAFKINGTPFLCDGMGIITGKVRVEQYKQLSRSYGASITGFTAGLLAYTIYNNLIKDHRAKNKLVQLQIPVNMRNIYPTSTVRNFALFTRPGHDFSREITLEECVRIFDDGIKQGIRKENLDRVLSSNVRAERNVLLKIMPLFIKDLALKIAFATVGDVLHTTTISNLGNIKFPASMQEYVKDVLFCMGTSYTCKSVVSLSSYDGWLNITFTREIVENNLEHDFFYFLTANGVQTQIFSNYWEDGNETV